MARVALCSHPCSWGQSQAGSGTLRQAELRGSLWHGQGSLCLLSEDVAPRKPL